MDRRRPRCARNPLCYRPNNAVAPFLTACLDPALPFTVPLPRPRCLRIRPGLIEIEHESRDVVPRIGIGKARFSHAAANLEIAGALVLHHASRLGATFGVGRGLQDIRQGLIAREGHPQFAQTLHGHGLEQTAGAHDLNAVIVHVHLHLGSTSLRRVIAMEQRIGHRLAHRYLGVFRHIGTESSLHPRYDAHVAPHRGHGLGNHDGNGAHNIPRLEKTHVICRHIGLRAARNNGERHTGPWKVPLRKATEGHEAGQGRP